MGVILASLEVLRGGVRLEIYRIVDPLIGPQTRNAHHPAVGLAKVAQPLLTHVSGLSAPFAIPMLVYDQNAFVVGGGSGVFEQEFEPALVNLLLMPPRFREKPLQALRFPSLRSNNRLGALARAVKVLLRSAGKSKPSR